MNDEEDDHVYPLSALKNDDVRAELKRADVIFGHDDAQGGELVLFYGIALLHRMLAEGRSPQFRVFNVSYDSRTDQLEWLVAAVRALKGSCCYNDNTSMN
jgi:hypothetical protein